MIFNFNKPYVANDGTVVNDNIGKILADFLGAAPEQQNAVKYWGWANKLAKGEALDLDLADEGVLRGFIQSNPNMIVAVRAQLLLLVMEAEKNAEKKGK